MSESDRTMCVDERCTIVDVGAVLPERAADVEGRVVRTDDDALLAAVGVRPGWAEEWCWSPRKTSCPGRTGTFGFPDIPVASTSCFGRSSTGLPSRSSTVHPPLLGRLVVAGAERAGVGPVVQLHHPRVGLEPVGDLVLGGEHRPVVRELDVGQVVVPDRVVQAERLVPAAPLVAGPRVLVDRRSSGRRAAAAARRARCRPARRRRPGRRAGWRSRAPGPPARRRSSQVSRSRWMPCSAPLGRRSRTGSSWPVSS